MPLHAEIDERAVPDRITIRDQVQLLCELVEGLEPRDRLLYLLYRSYGHTQADIATLLGIHSGNVSKRLKNITKRLQENLNCQSRIKRFSNYPGNFQSR